MEFRITDNMNPANAAKFADRLLGERLFISSYDDYGAAHRPWVERLEGRLIDGSAHGLLATDMQKPIGGIAFRAEPDRPEVIGIRNISIDPEYRNRYFGACLLRNAEILMSDIYPEASDIKVDTKLTNNGMITFLERLGYSVSEIVDLYQSGHPDVVLSKPLFVQGATACPQPSDDRSTH